MTERNSVCQFCTAEGRRKFMYVVAPSLLGQMLLCLGNRFMPWRILYPGPGASALCFVTWNLAVKVPGVVKDGVCIYMVPVITVVISVLALKEPVTRISIMERF